MLRLFLTLLASACLSGCFVLEELESGDAIIEQHSVGLRQQRNDAAEAEAEALAAKPPPGLVPKKPGVGDKLQALWRDALEEARPTPDPSDVVVQCEVAGSVLFSRKSDCQLRGGRITLLQAKPEPGA